MVGCGTSVVPPILLESGRMPYPEEQRKTKVEGSVLVAYDILVDGYVSNVRVISSNPEGVFDAAALHFVRSWRFQPRKRNGVPEVATDMESRISFTLSDGDASYLDFIE